MCLLTKRGGLARFANHCCEPNCYTRIIVAGGKQRIVLYSKERIELGEEITYDYKFDLEEDRSKAIPCCCGARSRCAFWLTLRWRTWCAVGSGCKTSRTSTG